MCTVTFIKTKDAFILTSNRDENPVRNALSFKIKEINGLKFVYPVDTKSSGTWLAVSENGNAIVLLNGAFEKHIRAKNYRKSRGLILLDILQETNWINAVEQTDLTEIEPFTLLIFHDKTLTEFRWDGKHKFFSKKDHLQPHIWSSATLYDKAAQNMRATLFQDFIENKRINEVDIADFHLTKTEDVENGIMIDRNPNLKTVSTTQLLIAKSINIRHWDHQQKKSKTYQL